MPQTTQLTRIALASTLFLLASTSAWSQCALDGDRLATVVPNAIYRVWSDVTALGPPPVLKNRAAIYVFKGVETPPGSNVWTVYLFGSGYGDPNSDIEQYDDQSQATRNAEADAADVAHVITDANCFGLAGKTVKLRAIVPHGHVDHINTEFIDELLGITDANFQIHRITYHLKEDTLVTCDSKCCETELDPPCQVCDAMSCKAGYGAPFLEAWADHPELVQGVRDAVGTLSDTPCTPIAGQTYPITAAPGQMRLELDSSVEHTTGALNIVIEPDLLPPPGDGMRRGAVFSGGFAGCFLNVYAGLGYGHWTQHWGNHTDCPEG